jgi:ABC-type dipeptide/oligopeptide/nickel transport system permease subunit
VTVWALAWQRFVRDRVGVASAAIVLAFLLMMAASAAGLIVRDWGQEVGVSYAPPGFLGAAKGEQAELVAASRPREDHGIADPLAAELAEIQLGASAGMQARAPTLPFGADKWGRDVIKKAIKGSETSLVVGITAAALAAFLGTFFGALAGYYGGWIDDFFNWLYSVFTSIPYLLLVLAIAAVLGEKGVLTVVLILGITGWTGIFRLVRAEYLKHKVREYVLAADAIGASHARRMFGHILPNVSHVVLVQLSLHVVLFIKSEVILSFLGFGVGVDTVSWGSMLAEAPSELILGMWWQIAAATVIMALAVTAFSLFTDAVRDALDPKLA